MITVFFLIFCCSVFLTFYTYAGYPLLLIIGKLIAKKSLQTDLNKSFINYRPLVNVVLSAFNEEKHIKERVKNLLDQKYPGDIEIYIGLDGCTDNTINELQSFTNVGNVHIFNFEKNRGKISVINELLENIKDGLVVFTDANTMFENNAIGHLVNAMSDPAIGGVSGKLVLFNKQQSGNIENSYWQYETIIKELESQFKMFLGANGAIYAIRREFYKPLPINTIVDDFMISMNVSIQGKTFIFTPNALAFEEASDNSQEEFKRRIRIGIGDYQALMWLIKDFGKMRTTTLFAFLSHKALRWFVPHLLILIVCATFVLSFTNAYFKWLFLCEFVTIIAFAGYMISNSRDKLPRLLRIPMYFLEINFALLIGFFKYFTKNYSGRWTRSAR